MRFIALSLAAFGCQSPDPPKAPTPAPPAAEHFIEAPEPFVRDIATSETASSAVQKDVGTGLCRAIRARDANSLELQLRPEFKGLALAPPDTEYAGEPTVRSFANQSAPAERGAWARALIEHTGAYAAITRCRAKPYRFRLDATDPTKAWAELHFDLDGQAEDGAALTDRGDLEVSLVLVGGSWRVTRAQFLHLQQVQTTTPPMSDISEPTGVQLFRDRLGLQLAQDAADMRTIETIGGVAVIDWDRDGDPDVLAWIERRAMNLYLNDGAGGFVNHPNVLPPRAVGVFNLLIDLDGDGVEELVSSAAVCMDGKAQLPVYRRTEDTFAPVPGALLLDRRCATVDDLTYQHITPADVDGDGDLDLFVSGYESHAADQNFNKFYSEDGVENLMFINQGGLRFTEEAAARGLSGHRASYVATFFDYDRDGDDDLYVVNDFAPNELFLSDGKGRYVRENDPQLTENGQSMGVTVADFDGDLDLDVYVSNMYSSAGHRIAPLFADQLRPETAKSLQRLAEGNALYGQEGAGVYREQAHELGIAHAGWAWGQAWFDADNDGDRDLYVVNGMTSHSEIREHDF